MNADELRDLAALKTCGHGWKEIARTLGVSWQQARGQWRRKCKDLDPGPCPICGDGPGERSSWSEEGNYAEASLQQAGNPLSLDQFKALLGVDETVWKVKDWTAQRWQVGAKIVHSNLTFKDSLVTGWKREDGLGKEDLWSHKASFIRHEPIAVRPVVQPVACSVSYTVPPPSRDSVNRALLAADLHIGYRRDNRTGRLIPFHDRRAIDAFLQVVQARAHLLDAVFILGDMVDFTNWSDKFARSPDFYWTTQPAILEAHWILRRLRELVPDVSIVLFQGNHEIRVRRALEAHLIEAYDLRAADALHLPPALSPQRLLALDALGIEWVDEYPGGERWLGPLRASHGEVARQPPGASTRAVVEDSQCDNAFGHTHRLEMVSKVVRIRGGSKVVKALSVGCLCHTDGRVPGSKRGDNWQKGIALVSYTEDEWSPTLVSLGDDPRAIVGVRAFCGQDYTDALRADLPDWNW